MRLILALPDLEKATRGPIGIGKRGGKIYGYDAHGKPIYSPSEAAGKKEHRGQAGYAERREATQERKLARAKKLEAEAKSRQKAARHTMEIIPPGQPILVGHHSEKRHRRDLERMDRNFRAARDAQEKADRLKAAAENPSSAISADDPEAVVKLKEKLADLEEERTKRKAVNKAFRKHKGDWARIQAELGLSESRIATIKRNMTATHWEKMPYPSFSLSNLGARIRDTKKRIESLAAEAARPAAKPVEGAGWRIHEDVDDNRIWVSFDSKPPKEVTREMKSHGFKWSPGRGAWIRQLNNAGRYAAERVASSLAKTTLPGATSPTTDKPVETEQQRQRRLEQPHLEAAAKHRKEYARFLMMAEHAMDTVTGVKNSLASKEERSRGWNEAAAHLQHAITKARDGNAVWDEIHKIRGDTPDTKTRENEIKRIERNIELATAKAANPDAHLPLPEGLTVDNFAHESKRTREIANAKARAEQKERSLDTAAKRARLMLAREAKAREQMEAAEKAPSWAPVGGKLRVAGKVMTVTKAGKDMIYLEGARGAEHHLVRNQKSGRWGLVDSSNRVHYPERLAIEGVQKPMSPEAFMPKPEPKPLEKKPAQKGRMAAREKAGQLLLLSRTAQLHLDN